MRTQLKSEPKSGQYSFEVVGVIDEKCGSSDIVFLAEFTQEQDRKTRICRWRGLMWRNSPARDRRRRTARLVVVDADHGFVESDVIRAPGAGRL